MCLCLNMTVVHGNEQGKRLGACLVVKSCVLYVVSLQHECMHHLRRWPKAAGYTRYILVPQKGRRNCACTKTKGNTFNF